MMTIEQAADADMPRGLAVAVRALAALVAATLVLAVLAYPWLHAYIVAWTLPWLGTVGAVGALALAVALMLLPRLRRRLVAAVMLPSRKGFLWWLCAGSFVLRVAVLRVIRALPGEAAPQVDWVIFRKSALLAPGHGLVMDAVHLVMGNTYAAEALFAGLLVVGVTLMVFDLARRAYGEEVGRLSAISIALLPSWLMYGHLEYDILLGFFEVLVAFAFFRRPARRHTLGWLAMLGLLIGFTCLIKPIALIFPGVLLIIYLALRLGLWASIKKTAVVTVFMLAAICPWTVRNYLVLNRFVLLTTNVGTVLYTGNHPEATGLPSRDLLQITPEMTDEVEMNRILIRDGLRFIRENPGQFLRLMAYRQVWTWGSDCAFVSTVMHDKVCDAGMNVLRGVVQLPYVLAVGPVSYTHLTLPTN